MVNRLTPMFSLIKRGPAAEKLSRMHACWNAMHFLNKKQSNLDFNVNT